MAITAPAGPYELNAGLAANPIVAIASPKADAIVSRGNAWVHLQTKSTVNEPVVYCVENACGDYYYKKGQVSATTNKLVDCELVPEFSASISLTTPFNASAGEIQTFLEALAEKLALNAAEFGCPTSGGPVTNQ